MPVSALLPPQQAGGAVPHRDAWAAVNQDIAAPSPALGGAPGTPPAGAGAADGCRPYASCIGRQECTLD
jgi:hypothetical protein